MKIVIIGGTGRIGSKVAEHLRNKGHDVVQSAPSTGVDTLTGEGLADVLAGAEVVLDVSNSPSFEPSAVLSFFERSTANLLAAERAAGVSHHVALSIVGIERSPDNGYFRAKVAQESLIKKGGVGGIADEATVDRTVRVSSGAFQPIAADDVAAFVAEATIGKPENQTIEIAGPEKKPMSDFISEYLAAVGDSRKVVADPDAKYFGTRVDDQALVPLGSAKLGKLDFRTWNAKHPQAAA